MSGLPSGWSPARLGDVLTLINGRAYKKHEMLNAGTPILRIQNLNGGDNWFYSDLDLPDDKYAKKGDLLYAWSATFGPYWCRWDKVIFHYHIWNVEPAPGVSKKFAYYELLRITQDIRAAAHGVAMPHMTKEGMEGWEIILPPLAEQTRIAARLDELLAQVDTLKARIDGIPALLKRFRQSVLAAAVSGRLTEEWRGEGALQSWSECLFGDLLESSFYGPRFGATDYTSELAGIPTVRTTDMTFDGRIKITETTPKVLVDEGKKLKFLVRKGDLLVTRSGSIGVMALFDLDAEAIPSAYLIRFRFLSKVIPRFGYFILASPAGQQALGLSAKAITQANVNAESIKMIGVKLPPLAEQTEIVRRVEQLFAFADQLEARVNQARSRIDRLTQSILAKAFRGELVPQDPNDEPASALLQRIQAQRAAAPKPRRTRKKASSA